MDCSTSKQVQTHHGSFTSMRGGGEGLPSGRDLVLGIIALMCAQLSRIQKIEWSC